MFAFNSPDSHSQNTTGILLDKNITVQAAAEVTGYNAQYLRRLLRTQKLEGIKVGQVWLIKMESLGKYLKQAEATEDQRCGPKNLPVDSV